MIEILILYTLSKGIRTMYGIKKFIEEEFSVFATPSLGTIKPALTRLENNGCISYRKSMSKGGRPSVYYSINDKGRSELKTLLLNPMAENPVQFLMNARIRLYCAGCLDEQEIKELINILKLKTEALYSTSLKLIEQKKSDDFYSKIVLDNLNCEYKNFVLLAEGILHAGKH